jgi:hypothetical protein
MNWILRALGILGFGAAPQLLGGCATAANAGAYVGRPITEAVARLGKPHEVLDYQGGGRYFSWSTSDVIITGEEPSPSNWLTPTTRVDPSADRMDEAQLESLPPWIVSPGHDPRICTLTLVARWDEARRGWITKKVIRKGPGPGGRCGLRTSN